MLLLKSASSGHALGMLNSFRSGLCVLQAQVGSFHCELALLVEHKERFSSILGVATFPVFPGTNISEDSKSIFFFGHQLDPGDGIQKVGGLYVLKHQTR